MEDDDFIIKRKPTKQSQEKKQEVQNPSPQQEEQKVKQPVVEIDEEEMYSQQATKVENTENILIEVQESIHIFFGHQIASYDFNQWDAVKVIGQGYYYPVLENASVAVLPRANLKGMSGDTFLCVTGGFEDFITSEQAFILRRDMSDLMAPNKDFDLAGELQNMPAPRYLHQSVIVQRGTECHLFVLGGKESVADVNSSKQVWSVAIRDSDFKLESRVPESEDKLDKINRSYTPWVIQPEMNEGRHSFAAINRGNFIYVYGGITAQDKSTPKLNTICCERFEFTTSKPWEKIEIKNGPSIASFGWSQGFNGDLFILGGSDGQKLLKSFYKVDVDKRECDKMKAEYPIEVAYPKLVASLKIENQKETTNFYAIGGLHSKGQVHKLLSTDNQWQKVEESAYFKALLEPELREMVFNAHAYQSTF